MEIIDNFLNQEDLKNIRDYLISYNFSWHFLNSKCSESLGAECSDDNNYQFCHMFYDDNQTNQYVSQYFSLLSPIIQKLNTKSLIRIKSNLSMKSDRLEKYCYHTDTNFDCKTAIFYLNTNDGFTVFENGSKVESIENRILIFNSQLKHTGTTCTDQKFRMVINFNYF